MEERKGVEVTEAVTSGELASGPQPSAEEASIGRTHVTHCVYNKLPSELGEPPCFRAERSARKGTPMDQDEIAIEREKLVIEREKLSIEKDKAATEEKKATTEGRKADVEEKKLAEERKRTRFTFWSVLVAALAVIASTLSQERTAAKAFDTKIAEILMNTSGRDVAQDKCDALRSLYPAQLEKLVCQINPPGVSSPLPEGDTDVETKKEFFKLLAAKENDPRKIVKDWKLIFPGDKWIDALAAGAPPH